MGIKTAGFHFKIHTIQSTHSHPIQKASKIPLTYSLTTQGLNLAQSSNKQPLIIPARLPFDPMHKTLMILVLKCALDLSHMIPVPMDSNHSIGQQRIVGTGASHRVFEEHSVAHGLIGTRAELVEQGCFHVAREFLKK